jgi:SAM-dependent methyltransferase
MIQRSFPGYGMIISNIGILAAIYAQPVTHCYDLGCSLGAATLAMRNVYTAPECDIIAVDNSQAMIERRPRAPSPGYGVGRSGYDDLQRYPGSCHLKTPRSSSSTLPCSSSPLISVWH